MKKFLLVSALVCALSAHAASFEEQFRDSTLRLDYSLAGMRNAPLTASLRRAYSLPKWAGPRVNLNKLPYEADGIFTLTDAASGDTLYTTSFATLFQEWLTTDEALTTPRAMDHVVIAPMPRRKAIATLELRDYSRRPAVAISHPVDPADILIRPLGQNPPLSVDLSIGGPVESTIDVAIIGEGYTAAETEKFLSQARAATTALRSHEPFRSLWDKFNVRAVIVPSRDSGVSIPKDNRWITTPFGSHFSTFYSDRYLTSSEPVSIHNALAGVPYEHIIVLANTEEYGGGGIFNEYTLTAGGHELMRPVVVHEFGHSFGGLGDEYFYEAEQNDDYYPHSVEPWHPNLTTLVDFNSKWKHLLPKGTPVPTPVELADEYPLGVYEGGGYSFKGIYRPADQCRMRNNQYPSFCPACIDALRNLIEFYTSEPRK